MIVFSYPAIKNFTRKHADAADALNNWFNILHATDFANYRQLKQVFSSVEGVGNDRYIFDIKGNKYRLVAMIHFNVRTVYIRFIGTHVQYDRIEAKTI